MNKITNKILKYSLIIEFIITILNILFFYWIQYILPLSSSTIVGLTIVFAIVTQMNFIISSIIVICPLTLFIGYLLYKKKIILLQVLLLIYFILDFIRLEYSCAVRHNFDRGTAILYECPDIYFIILICIYLYNCYKEKRKLKASN